MIDIAVREIRNLGPDQESLQQAYLSLLPGLAKVSAHVSSPNSMHKRSDMVKLLMELQGSRFSTDQVRRLATRIMENNEALSP